MVECGGLENRFTCNPGNEGSNPSSSARKLAAPRQGRVCYYGEEGFEPMRWNSVKKTCQWHVFRNSPDRACEGGVGLRRRRSRNPVHSTIVILQVRKRACFCFRKVVLTNGFFCCRCARAGRALRCLPFRSSGSTGGGMLSNYPTFCQHF